MQLSKKIAPILGIAALLLCGFQCERYDYLNTFTGKLAVAGICSNYTITLEEGSLSDTFYEATWTDPQTSLTYQKAFRLGNPCDFPAGIRAGDTFKFIIERDPSTNCATCMAYYPTPVKTLNIRVVNP